MRYLLVSFYMIISACAAYADEAFQTYSDFEQYVDKRIKNREFSTVISRLGGADEYTKQQLQMIQNQLRDVVPFYLTDVAIVKRIELENGFSQEMRAYWNKDNSYLFLYAFLQERNDGVIVLQFSMNTSPEPVLQMF